MPSIWLPYTNVFGTGARPYLTLTLTGPNGTSRHILGLLDTGADRTALPVEHAAPMGYATDALDRTPIVTVGGHSVVFRAREPSRAVLPGAPGAPISMCPLFIPGADLPFWGRIDVMRPFKVLFDEIGQVFTLSW